MNRFVKPIALLGLAGVMTVGAFAPQAEARNGRWAAGAAGFAVGAAVGAAAANANAGYYDRGYYAPGYAYEPAYAEPTYVEPSYSYGYNTYAYEPAPRYYYNRGVNRPNNSYTIKERHLNGTE
jgi:hypothetical protein